MRTRVWRWLAVVLVAALAGCEISHVDPKAEVHISGRALDAGGRPLAGAKVRLFKQADLGDLAVGAVLAVGTLGAVCLVPEAPAVCHKGRTARTDVEGSYRFDLKGADTQGMVGTASTLELLVPGPDGAATTASFKVRGAETPLPDVRLWDAGLRLSEPAGRIHLDWKPLPAEAGTSPTYSVQLLDASSRGLLWAQPATPTGGDVDNRMVEDVRSTASAAVTARLGDVRVSTVSTSLEVTGRAGPPPSRGRQCLAVNAPDLSTTPQANCGATDGNLTAPTSLAGNSGAVVSGVVVDLGSARRATLVVVRGLGGDYVVEGSSDGTTYSQLAAGSTSPAAFPLATPPTARFVRVWSPSGLDESLLAEVSVW